jgi:hypothetical protein
MQLVYFKTVQPDFRAEENLHTIYVVPVPSVNTQFFQKFP